MIGDDGGKLRSMFYTLSKETMCSVYTLSALMVALSNIMREVSDAKLIYELQQKEWTADLLNFTDNHRS